ncbi:MAG TPA: hypothetical protein VGM31_14355 [Puia sp.]|jgi:hypothetical protein
MSPVVQERGIAMLLLYCDGRKISAIAADHKTSERYVHLCFEELRAHYGAATTPNLIAILFREGVIR